MLRGWPVSRHRLAVAAIPIALLSAGVAIWWYGKGSSRPAPVERPIAISTAGIRDDVAGAPPSPAGEVQAVSRKPAALPPPDAPLAQVLPALQASADAGDRRAACRLGMELLRCQHLGTWDALMSKVMGGDAEMEFEERGNLAAANSIAEERLSRIEGLQQCRSVPESLRSQGGRYLRQAALAGEPHAMLAYAEGHHWPPDGRGVALGADFDLWRQEAPAMMHAALRAGNPTAAFMLQMNYSDDFGFLSAMIPDDTYRSYVYHLLSARLFGHRERQALARDLDAAAMERAGKEAIELHERYFGGRRFPSSMALRYPPYVRTGADVHQAFCEDPK